MILHDSDDFAHPGAWAESKVDQLVDGLICRFVSQRFNSLSVYDDRVPVCIRPAQRIAIVEIPTGDHVNSESFKKIAVYAIMERQGISFSTLINVPDVRSTGRR